jgi:chromosome segregation ATPase
VQIFALEEKIFELEAKLESIQLKEEVETLKEELKLKEQEIEDIESKLIEPIILEKNELQKEFVEVENKYEGLSLHMKSLEKENHRPLKL